MIEAKNTTSQDVLLLQLGLTVPASGSVDLTGPNRQSEILDDEQLKVMIGDGTLILVHDSIELSKADSLSLVTLGASYQPPGTGQGWLERHVQQLEKDYQIASDRWTSAIALKQLDLIGGTYEVSWFYEWDYSRTNRGIYVRVVAGSDEIHNFYEEPKDRLNRICVGGSWDIVFPAGVVDVRLDVKCSNRYDRAMLYRRRLCLKRVG